MEAVVVPFVALDIPGISRIVSVFANQARAFVQLHASIGAFIQNLQGGNDSNIKTAC
jgi:hypothetical protein